MDAKKPTKKYLEDRAEQLVIQWERISNKYLDEVDIRTVTHRRELINLIGSFLGKFKDKITLQDMRSQLTQSELRELKTLLRAYQRDLDKIEDLSLVEKKQLGAVISMQSRKRVSNLDALQVQLNQHLVEHGRYLVDTNAKIIEETQDNTYKKAMFYLSVGFGVGFALSKLDTERPLKTKSLMTQKTMEDTYWDKTVEYQKRISNSINQQFVQGSDYQTVVKKIEKHMGVKEWEARRIVRTTVSQTCNEILLNTYSDFGIEMVEFSAILDMRTSEICRSMHGSVFPRSEAIQGVNTPPLHPNCYDKETEVYTNKGWKLFKDLDRTEKFWSIDPKTLEPSWVSAKEYIEYQYTGNLINFTNKTFDLCVTPNHNLFLKYVGTGANGDYRFVEAKNCPVSKNVHYRGVNWTGNSPKMVKLGDYDVTPELFCTFMAYWLSEGSIVTRHKKQSGYTVNIAQTKYLDKFIEDLKDFPIPLNVYRNPNKNDSRIYFSDKSIYNYLKQFGKSHQKFVPKTIKSMTKEHIKLFLGCYALGDGSTKLNKGFGDYKRNYSTCFFTSSVKMRDDLGELIMKVGGRPKFSLPEGNRAGSPCFNGKYKMNHDVWHINWGTKVHTYTEHLTRNEIPYDDKVYCVELEKFHTLLVKRNGRVTWCGNCRSVIIPYLNDDGKNTYSIGRDDLVEVNGSESYRNFIKKMNK